MCRRVIINSGIKRVVMRTGKDTYNTVNVQEWVINDDSIRPEFELN
jgi:dCMP deaminase